MPLVWIAVLMLVRQVLHGLIGPRRCLLLVLHLHRRIEASCHVLLIRSEVVGERGRLGWRIREHSLFLLLHCRHGPHVEVCRILHIESVGICQWRSWWILQTRISLIRILDVVRSIGCIAALLWWDHLRRWV